jgi:hypothetical protein
LRVGRPKLLKAIDEAEALAERSEERWWSAELHRLRGVFLATLGTEETQIEAFIAGSHQHRKATEVDFARETHRSDLHGIPSPKSERFRRMWIPNTSLVTAHGALSLGLWEFQRYQANAWDEKRVHFGSKRSPKGGVLSQRCLGELVIKGPARLTPLSKPCSLLGLGLWLHRLSGGRDGGAHQSQVSEFSKVFVKSA